MDWCAITRAANALPTTRQHLEEARRINAQPDESPDEPLTPLRMVPREQSGEKRNAGADPQVGPTYIDRTVISR
ncbi:MAG: hypothetical protein HY657_07365 [Acidobacteria bacterium]|nr:hypothetical protein [Acidobacteriota bacterium]